MTSAPNAQSLIILIGRILFSMMFVLAGIGKIHQYQGTVDYMVHAGLPYAHFLIIPAIIFELGGGVLILLGLFTRFGAFLLFIFTLTVSFAVHHFWTYTEAEAFNQLINFQKNISICGGCLYIMAFGGGFFSLDQLRRRLNGR